MVALSAACEGPKVMQVGDDMGGPPADLAGKGPEAYFRFGHFTVGAAPFDVCVKGPTDTNFSGPLVRTQTPRTGGVPYANVSAYLTVQPSSYTVRATPGAATDCKTSFGGLPDLNVPALALGRHYTIVASGDLTRIATTIKFSLIEDDLTGQGGQAKLRFINAAPDLQSADLGFGSGGMYTEQITGALYGSFGRASGQEYLVTAPLSNATVAVRSSGASTDTLAIMGKISVASNSVATALIGGLPGDLVTPPSLVLCNDSVPPSGGFSSCTEYP